MTTGAHDDPETLGRDGLGLLLQVTTLLSADMARGLPARGLTQARASLLWILGEQGPQTQRALADELGVSARNVTGLVDALVETGFVTREAHPADGRAVLVTPTARGTSELAAMAAEYDGLAARLFGGMSPTRLAGLVEGLADVVGELHEALDVDMPFPPEPPRGDA
ncbi:hypothetical protein GCM10009737_18620 [Nocardioides lentus]|uniref:HTH marR-type domain-containing protein n=1 Tax=Nocardioides lentus TaxID=338077 RepID=A0ABP5AMC9_9ACTN